MAILEHRQRFGVVEMGAGYAVIEFGRRIVRQSGCRERSARLAAYLNGHVPDGNDPAWDRLLADLGMVAGEESAA